MDNALKLRVMFDMVDGITKPLKNMLAGNKELANSLKDTRRKLAEVGKTQKSIAEFREMRTSLASTASQLHLTRTRAKELARALRSAGPPSRQMIADLEKTKQAAARLTGEHRKQVPKVHELRERLRAVGIDTRNLSHQERQLRVSMAATTATMAAQQNRLAELTARTRKLTEAREKMTRLKERAGSMAGTGAIMTAGGAVVGAATLGPAAAYAKAEDSATQLAGALMRAGGIVPPAFEKINTLAMRLGDRLPGTTADFQDMMTMLTRQGISAKTILGGVGEATAYLAVQLKKTPTEAAEFAAKLQDATRTTEKNMLSLSDVIQKAFYLGVDDNNMLNGFAKLGPAMDTIKLKGLEGAKALAPLLVMADQSGMEGGAAGNAYRKVFQLSMDSKKVGKANNLLDASQKLDFTNGEGEFGGLDNMFRQFKKLKGLTTEKRLNVMKGIFGDDAETLQVISLLIEKGKAGYDEVQAKMAAQASLQERVNMQLGTLKNLWEAASGTFTNGLVALGETIAPEVKGIVEWLSDMAAKMGAWARENPRTANSLMKVVAAFGLLLIAGGALTVALAGALGPLAILRFSMATLGMQGGMLKFVFSGLTSLIHGGFLASLRIAGQAIVMLGRLAMANPLFAVISLLALGAIYVWQNWDALGPKFAALWETIKGYFGAAGDWFDSVGARFKEIGTNLISGLVSGITSRIGAVKDAITNVASSTVAWFKEKLGIHSPSRVFGELGGFISQGAAMGMEGEQARVARAALSLATVAATAFGSPAIAAGAQLTKSAAVPLVRPSIPIDARPPLIAAPAAASAGGAASQFVINIYPPTGVDAAEIGRMVRAELERAERAKRSRIASRLSD